MLSCASAHKRTSAVASGASEWRRLSVGGRAYEPSEASPFVNVGCRCAACVLVGMVPLFAACSGSARKPARRSRCSNQQRARRRASGLARASKSCSVRCPTVAEPNAWERAVTPAIPAVVIDRLSAYRRTVCRLQDQRVACVSSAVLAETLGVPSSLVRKDLSQLGHVGTPGQATR
jgi:Putative DNA-binding protein N-terminus